MQMPDDRYEPISVDEAASRLNVSPSTVRRMIRDGKLKAEREQRPQGEIVRVLWPATVADASDVPPPVTTPSEPPTTAPAIDLPAALSAALEPLTEALALERTERQRLAQENGELREDRGRLTAELEARSDALEMIQTMLDVVRDQLARIREKMATPWWRRLFGG